MLKKLSRLMTPPVIEQRSIHLAGKPVTYTLKRTGRRRSIGLRIDERGPYCKRAVACFGKNGCKASCRKKPHG